MPTNFAWSTGATWKQCFRNTSPEMVLAVAAVCDRRQSQQFEIAGGHRPPLQLQNTSFRPNWMVRAIPTVLVIRPAVGVRFPRASNTEFAGLAKFAWLKMLKNSARNWMFLFSANAVLLSSEKSTLLNRGPMSVCLPAFP